MNEVTEQFDPVVLGAGPGGYVAAIRAAQLTACRGAAGRARRCRQSPDRTPPIQPKRDRAVALLRPGWTGDAAAIRERFDQAGTAGVTDVIYVPAGPDIAGELEAFAAPTFTTFVTLPAGMVARPARRTVCGMLAGAGLAEVRHHNRAPSSPLPAGAPTDLYSRCCG